jgi:hypothetical protein
MICQQPWIIKKVWPDRAIVGPCRDRSPIGVAAIFAEWCCCTGLPVRKNNRLVASACNGRRYDHRCSGKCSQLHHLCLFIRQPCTIIYLGHNPRSSMGFAGRDGERTGRVCACAAAGGAADCGALRRLNSKPTHLAGVSEPYFAAKAVSTIVSGNIAARRSCLRSTSRRTPQGDAVPKRATSTTAPTTVTPATNMRNFTSATRPTRSCVLIALLVASRPCVCRIDVARWLSTALWTRHCPYGRSRDTEP